MILYNLPLELRSKCIQPEFWSNMCVYRPDLTSVHMNTFDNRHKFTGAERWSYKVVII